MGNKDLTLKEIYALVWTERKLIASVVSVVTLLAVIYSLLLPNWYKSTAVILPPASKQLPFGASGLLGQIGLSSFLGSNESLDRFIAILKSRTLKEAIINKYGLMEEYDLEEMSKALKAIDDNYEIEIGEEDQIIISFWDKRPEKVADIVNDIVHTLDSLNIAFHTGQASNSRNFIESRLEIVLDSLVTLENQVTSFMQNEGLLSLENQVKEGITAAAELQMQILKTEIELAVTRKTVAAGDPKIRKLELELESLRDSYKKFVDGKSQDRLFPSLETIPYLEVKLQRYQRKAEYYLKILEFLAPQYEQAKIEAAKEIPTFQVLDRGFQPERKDRPRRSRIVLAAFLLSFGAMAMWAYLRGRWKMIANNP